MSSAFLFLRLRIYLTFLNRNIGKSDISLGNYDPTRARPSPTTARSSKSSKLMYMQETAGGEVDVSSSYHEDNSKPDLNRGHRPFSCEGQHIYRIYVYKGSAPRAADAARYARARQGRMQLETCKGGRKKRPMIWCEHRFDNAKSCLKQVALLCSAVLCAFVTGVTF